MQALSATARAAAEPPSPPSSPPAQLFSNRNGYTYNDYIILPGFIDFAASDVDLSTQATKGIKINVPFVSSPMDTVTEAQMAIHMALYGGLGIIHCNNSIEGQCDEVRRVKRFENGFILDPFTVSPDASLSTLDEIKARHGFSGCPVTEDGKLGGKLLGIVTTRDHDFVTDRSIKVSEIMTTEVVTAPQGCTLKEANEILKKSKKGKLPVTDSNGCLVAAISRKDLRKNRDFPNASKARRDRGLHSLSARWTYDGGHFPHRTRASGCSSAPPCTRAPRTRRAWRRWWRRASTSSSSTRRRGPRRSRRRWYYAEIISPRF